jgi:hypothetical protein
MTSLETPRTVYVSIGNSDDRLSQADWARFLRLVINNIKAYASVVHGVWLSAPDSEFQNACVCFQLSSDAAGAELRDQLTMLRMSYHQDAIAWAQVTDTTMI